MNFQEVLMKMQASLSLFMMILHFDRFQQETKLLFFCLQHFDYSKVQSTKKLMLIIITIAVIALFIEFQNFNQYQKQLDYPQINFPNLHLNQLDQFKDQLIDLLKFFVLTKFVIIKEFVEFVITIIINSLETNLAMRFELSLQIESFFHLFQKQQKIVFSFL